MDTNAGIVSVIGELRALVHLKDAQIEKLVEENNKIAGQNSAIKGEIQALVNSYNELVNENVKLRDKDAC